VVEGRRLLCREGVVEGRRLLRREGVVEGRRLLRREGVGRPWPRGRGPREDGDGGPQASVSIQSR
jgi:hypothetical protein